MKDTDRLPDPVCRLEDKLKRLRFLSGRLLSIDMYERWGNGQDKKMNAEMKAAAGYGREWEALETDIRRECKRLSNAERQAWSAAHIALLEEFRQRRKKDKSDSQTALSVADEETEEWQKLGRGKTDFIHQNSYYIQYDNSLYKKFFGYNYE